MSNTADAILAATLAVFAGVGMLTVMVAIARRFERKGAVSSKKPECEHAWEPWSDPKDVEVKEASYFGLGQTTAKTFVGKYQERVCSACNLYERRWA